MIHIYTRVSTQGQVDRGDSIAAQQEACLGWADFMHPGITNRIYQEKAISSP